MAGQFLQGVTESMLHLANQHRAEVETMAGSQRNMAANMEATASQWMGSGSNACQQVHSSWDSNSTSRVLVPGNHIGDNISTVGNLYDNTDLNAQSTMSSIGSAINPTA
jgi:uncharacterized protein YukE